MTTCLLLALFASAQTQAQTYEVETVASHLAWPWSVAFLPAGDFLVAEKTGRVQRVARDGSAHDVPGFPADAIGLAASASPFDLVLDRRDPDTAYACYARWTEGAPAPGHEAGAPAAVAVVRLSLDGDRIARTDRLFQQDTVPFAPDQFFGCRVAQDGDDILVALGERRRDADGRREGVSLGRVMRVPLSGAPASVVSSGHRNPEGLIVQDGKVYETEHGPMGGDELNTIHQGGDYGWPTVGHGIGYDGRPLMEATRAPGVEEPLFYWSPSIAPSGLALYDGKLFPDWRGSFLLGGLAAKALIRLDVRDGRPVGEERLLADRGQRIRDVRQGPDGAVYVLTDGPDADLLRLVPGHQPRGKAY